MLVDTRGAEAKLSTTELYELGEALAAAPSLRQSRIGLLAPPSEAENAHFWKPWRRNGSMDLRGFVEFKQAISWLVMREPAHRNDRLVNGSLPSADSQIAESGFIMIAAGKPHDAAISRRSITPRRRRFRPSRRQNGLFGFVDGGQDADHRSRPEIIANRTFATKIMEERPRRSAARESPRHRT